MDYTSTTDPTVLPPLLLQTVKEHMRVDFSYEDPDITRKIAAAIRIYEHKSGLMVNPAAVSWAPALDTTSTQYVLPMQPCSVFVALDADDLVVTSEYAIVSTAMTAPQFMTRVDGAVFPAGTTFELTIGYMTVEDIPADMLMSILRITGTLYEYRESVEASAIDVLPLFMDDLLVGNWVPRC